MAVTVSNYRIIPYAQKDGLAKVIFGGTWGITITLPTVHESGDGYILALDYERVVYPLARPVCAYSNSFALDGDALTMAVSLDTLRLAKWVSSIRKPTPICVQIVRVRGEIYETLLLDEILALPSVTNGDAYADPHSPIMDTLAEYVGDGATTIRQGGVVKGVITANQKTDNVIDLDAGGGGGSVEQATDAEIDARESTTHAITPNNLDYAGRSVVPNITAIPAATSAYALLDATATTNNHSWQYQHAPSAASTYTLPAVTDTAVAHYIRLTIDFTSVQTYAFEDSQGTAIAPLFTPTIAAGDVYEFDCEYSVAKAQWLIWPHKQGAVSDDYVMQSEVGAANGVAGLDGDSLLNRQNIPIASYSGTNTSLVGGVGLEYGQSGGLYTCLVTSNKNALRIRKSSYLAIDRRTASDYWDSGTGGANNCWPIVPANLNYAVRSVLPNITEIPAATTSYALLDATATTNNHSWQYQHAPSAASTYTLPAVTDTAVAHYIRLTIDFTSVQTYAFEDSQGTAIAPLFTPTIAAGDVYEFDCEYSVAKAQWLIWPHKQGAVSDDYVMQSEVGAANGVAGLDENGTVPVGELPEATTNSAGVVGVNESYGTTITYGKVRIAAANAGDISSRTSMNKPLAPYRLNYAVTAALTDANKIQLTDAQKASAQDTLGVGPAPIVYTTTGDAPTTSTVGAVGQLAVNTADSKAWTCEAITVDETDPQNPVTTYTWNKLVQLDSTGKVPSGELPVAGVNKLGLVQYKTTIYGIFVRGGGQGELCIASANDSIIDAKDSNYLPIVPKQLNYAVRSVLPNVTEIPAATSAYSLTDASATTNNHCYTYTHIPESAPTYTLPAVTGNAVKREIVLTVRFSSSVLTYAFEDSAGNAITPLPLAGTIADGSVVCFRCTWEALLNSWVIEPRLLNPNA